MCELLAHQPFLARMWGAHRACQGSASRDHRLHGHTMADLLVVDDDDDASYILKEFLHAQGHEVRLAVDGKQGLALLNCRRPDLVILDVEMPVLTGPEMAHLMFVHDLGMEEIPIILCSGVLDLTAVATIVGTPYFLGKPYTFDALLKLLKQALQERRPPTPYLPVHA